MAEEQDQGNLASPESIATRVAASGTANMVSCLAWTGR